MADDTVSEAIARSVEQVATMGGAPDYVEMDAEKAQQLLAEEQEATAQAVAKMVARLIQAAKDGKAHGVGRHLAAGCRHCAAVINAREFLKALAGPPEPEPPGEQLVEFEERTAA